MGIWEWGVVSGESALREGFPLLRDADANRKRLRTRWRISEGEEKG
ncbi:hypothetical protein [Anabaena subtropica]|uniref:Uncharacterized protein n=1 Tax=Anabaena subtropica FACHB-260 TaxID=2692884 RepID=A0ABR8CV98_9NOST|nr:hypothetical protein [Anabaena subtropica]MBD2347132.1 hypothetical protein [Anabaena subtropica FACHB-260]